MSKRYNSESNDNSGFGCLFAIIFGIIALPFVGLIMAIAAEDEGDKGVGIMLMVVGIIGWIFLKSIS